MARRTAALKPQLNQIRTWARDGRTDAWIAFQLGTTAATVQEFRSEHGLDKGGGNPAEEPVTPEHVVQTISFDSPPRPATPPPSGDEPGDETPSTRTRRQRRSRTPASADAAAGAESGEAAAVEAVAESDGASVEGEPAERAKRRRRRGGRGGGSTAAGDGTAASDASTADEPAASEKPARASAKRRPRTPASYEGSVVAGAVIVLDPAVARSAAWRAHWADGPAFDVVIDEDQIVLRRRTSS
jgi:hypothetical protein